MSADIVFLLKISVKTEKKRSSLFVMRPLIFYEVLRFLRGPRLQPAEPRRKSGPEMNLMQCPIFEGSKMSWISMSYKNFRHRYKQKWDI